MTAHDHLAKDLWVPNIRPWTLTRGFGDTVRNDQGVLPELLAVTGPDFVVCAETT